MRGLGDEASIWIAVLISFVCSGVLGYAPEAKILMALAFPYLIVITGVLAGWIAGKKTRWRF